MLGRSRTTRTKHPRIGATLGVGAALTMVVMLVWGQLQDDDADSTARQAIHRGLFPEGPVPGGKAVSIEEADRSFPMAAYRPNAGFALDERISGVWLRSDEDPVLHITNESGAIVEIRPAKGFQSTETFAQAQIKDGVPGELTTIQGVEAFVVPPDDLDFSGSIHLMVDDVLIVVVGGRDSFTPTADLLSVAAAVISNASTG